MSVCDVCRECLAGRPCSQFSMEDVEVSEDGKAKAVWGCQHVDIAEEGVVKPALPKSCTQGEASTNELTVSSRWRFAEYMPPDRPRCCGQEQVFFF